MALFSDISAPFFLKRPLALISELLAPSVFSLIACQLSRTVYSLVVILFFFYFFTEQNRY